MSERLCPLCNSKSKNFGLYGISNRPDSKCLNCGSTERYRLLYLYLSRETDFFTRKTNTFVDIGPKNGYSTCLEPFTNINHVSVDLIFGKSKIQGDIEKLPIASGIADYLICYHVLEHVADYKRALSEIYRVMKYGAISFIQVPIDVSQMGVLEIPTNISKERLKLYGQEDHVRIFGNDFEEVLKMEGFETRRIKYIEKFNWKERELYGLKDTYKIMNYETSEDIFVAKKM